MIVAPWLQVEGASVKTRLCFNDILRALMGCPAGIDEYWSHSSAEINKVKSASNCCVCALLEYSNCKITSP